MRIITPQDKGVNPFIMNFLLNIYDKLCRPMQKQPKTADFAGGDSLLATQADVARAAGRKDCLRGNEPKKAPS